MSLQLFGHPFSSYTWKVLIALWADETPFEFRMLGRSQCIENDRLHVRHYAEVEHAVEEANAPPELSVRNPAVGPGTVRLHMLDDASGFDH